MPLDPNIILGYKAPQIDNPINALGDALRVRNLQQQGEAGALQLDESRRVADETRQTAEAYKSSLNSDGTLNRNNLYTTLAQRGLGAKLPAVQKGFADQDKSKVEADAASFKLANERYSVFQKTMGALKDAPNLSKQMLMDAGANLVKQGILPQEMYDGAVANMPDDVTELRQRLSQGLATQMPPEKIFEVFAPKPEKFDTGGTILMRDMNPNSPTYGQATGGAPIAKAQTPDSVASIAAADRRHRETIAGENLRAGVSADGKMDENSERTAQAIASGQLPAPTGMALLNPKNQRILGRVMEINPQYDATSVEAKRKGARDFATGSQGNSMRSFAVAGQHLDQLGQLVDAMDNGNLQLVNKIANAYSQQTGNPAVTNFDAAKDVVSKEVVKAIVAGGGGVAERQELSHLMENAKSPAQLKGVIKQYRDLMAAQHDALLQQRDALGLPRSTLPKYTDANGSAPPAGGLNIDQSAIAAELARRGVK